MTDQPTAAPNSRKKMLLFGCLGLTLTCCCGGGVLIGLVNYSMTTSTAYLTGLERARQDPRVVEALGAPIAPGWMVTGSVSTKNGVGKASLVIPLKGAKHTGKLVVEAHTVAGEWKFERLVVTPDAGGGPINLLEGEKPEPRPAPPGSDEAAPAPKDSDD